MPKIISVCVECGASFSHFPSAKRLTCSTACGGAYRGKKRTGQKYPRVGARTGSQLTCMVCGNLYYRPAHVVAKGQSKYCSAACRALADRKPRTIQPCGYCGKEMSLKPSAVANGRTYCSMECRTLGQTKSWTLLERTHNGRPVKQDTKGYIWVWQPERGYDSQGGWYQEHRILVEASLGRRLLPEEHVHHVNGKKDDNRLSNLVVMSHEDHLVLSGQERLAAIALALAELAEYRRRYGPLTDWPSPSSASAIASGGSASAATR